MCGRYTLADTDHLGKRFAVERPFKQVTANFNVAPTQIMPVVSEGADGRQLELMRWGIPRFVGPGVVKDVFNTRSDKAFGSWKKMTLGQRILVPATGFYEWKKLDGGKQPYFIRPKDDELFAFAGIWNLWKNEDGQEVKTYSIMTTEPNKEMSGIHNRMPVILHPEDEAAWLNPQNSQSQIDNLLRPYEDNGLELYPVSADVNNARNNNPHLLDKISA